MGKCYCKMIPVILALFFTAASHAEEGMWPFNKIPVEKIREQYAVELTPEWIEHLQKSSLRISFGGSGSFISREGLVITNHHVGARALYDLSTKEKNLLQEGFYAHSLQEELKCPNMHVDQLIFIYDVTNEVNQDIKKDMSDAGKEKLRAAAIAKIKKTAELITGLYPEIVTLYGGAQFHLYLYKRYTDVRLVMAPEKKVAFFGGNTDNFEYPRYSLDICFFRVYENNVPVMPQHHLKWSERGPIPREPLFISGNPGRTRRLLTSDHLIFFEEHDLSLFLDFLQKRIQALETFSQQDAENQRIAAQDLFRYYNTEKACKGFLKGLVSSNLVQKKKIEEALLEKKERKPFKELKKALEKAKKHYTAYMLLEGPLSAYCKTYLFAEQLLRLSDEISKPNSQRLKEYADSELFQLKQKLLSEEPLYPELEKVLLEQSLSYLLSSLKKSDPDLIEIALDGKEPNVRARELIDSTQLFDLEYRTFLFENLEEVKKSNDSLIQLAKALDPQSRKLRKKIEKKLEGACKESYASIAHSLFEKFEESIYPDATFTLRLTYGCVRGFSKDGTYIPPYTTLGETFIHAKNHEGNEDFTLPTTWNIAEHTLEKFRPLNFISNHDIIGGNSGSPVVNGRGEFVGIVFDGNAESLSWDCAFSDREGRAISVHCEGIIETLEKIYKAYRLIREIKE